MSEKETKSAKTDNRPSGSRRNLIAAVAAGGSAITLESMPSRWAKPVVSSIMLPAHSQTSCCVELVDTVEKYAGPGSKYVSPQFATNYGNIALQQGTLIGTADITKYEPKYGPLETICAGCGIPSKYVRYSVGFGNQEMTATFAYGLRCGESPFVAERYVFSGGKYTDSPGPFPQKYTGKYVQEFGFCKYLIPDDE